MIGKDLDIEEANVEADYASDYITEREKPMPSFNHGFVQMRLGAMLLNKYDNQYLFISEVKLNLPNVKPAVPDICIFPKMEIDWLNDMIEMSSPPITVIEILSPKQGLDDIKDKFFNIYFPGGVKSAWLVIPTVKSVYIFLPDRTYEVFNDGKINDPVTGIELELSTFFPS